MKAIFLAFCGLLILGFNEASSDTAIELNPKCAAGPVYWCKNIKNAKSCGAMTHCIRTNSWRKYPVDSDSICQICLDMVAKARDILESNETQEELREVFEGTCAIIRIKNIREECDHLADVYEAQLGEMLTSHMDPHVVCSVAGLCNNAAIDSILAKTPSDLVLVNQAERSKGLTCKQCGTVSDLIRKRFDQTNRDQFLGNVLDLCGRLSSFSDACSAIVLSYFNEVYAHLEDNLISENICHMAGVCSAQFHQHDEQDDIEIVPLSQIGVVDANGDDLQCETCEQLILFLRDVLVANTTETEFKNVLEGICKQTKSFKEECLSIADQYSDEIYNVLIKELNPKVACYQIGLCPKELTKQQEPQVIAPFILIKLFLEKKKLLDEDEPVSLAEKELLIGDIGSRSDYNNYMTNTIPNTIHKIETKIFNPVCFVCKLVVKEIERQIGESKNLIDKILKKACSLLLFAGLRRNCVAAVENASDFVIDLIIKEVTPKRVCVLLRFCLIFDEKVEETLNIRTDESIEHFPTKPPKQGEDVDEASPECLLCEELIHEVEQKVKNDKFREHIKEVLEQACEYLPFEIPKTICLEAVDQNSDYIIDAIIKNTSAEEICYGLGICDGTGGELDENIQRIAKRFMTKYSETSKCVVCEFVMKQLENVVRNKSIHVKIIETLNLICSVLPFELSGKCKIMVRTANVILQLFIAVPPHDWCEDIYMCSSNSKKDTAQHDVLECGICLSAADALETILDNNGPKDRHIVAETTCNLLPAKYYDSCYEFMTIYVESMTNLTKRGIEKSELCIEIGKCFRNGDNNIFVEMKSTPSKAIESESNESSGTKRLVGASPCTYGPSYWCSSATAMNECKAHLFCQRQGMSP